MINIREIHGLELPRARGAYLEDAPESIWSNSNYVLEPKLDGTRESLQIGSQESLMIGRNRENFLKGVQNAGNFQIHQHPVFSRIACPVLDGTLLDGELTMSFTQDGEYDELTRIRQKEGIFVGYTVWQAIFYKGMDVRELPDSERRKLADDAISELGNPHIRLIDRYPATKEKLKEIWNTGGEGAIAKDSSASMKIGQRTQTDWFKLKTQNTVDAFVTGVTEGKSGGSGINGIKPQKNGTASTFTVSMMDNRGRLMPVAKVKNLPDQVQLDGFKNFRNYKFKVIEMRVSGWNGKSFRWARFMRFREDKNPSDCRFEEQIGQK